MKLSIRNILWFLSGEDYILIGRCTNEVQRQFTAIGIIVLALSIITLSSIFSLIKHVFLDTPLILSFSIGLLWCVLISNLYIFLLYTISPTLLPVSKNSRKRLRKGEVEITENFIYSPTEISRTFSLGLRILMILLLAIFIAQPLNMSFLINDYPKEQYMGLIKSNLIQMPISYVLTLVWCAIFLIPIFLKFRIRNNKITQSEFIRAGSSQGDLIYIRENLVSPESFEVLFYKIRSVKIDEFVTSDFYFYKSLVEYKYILDEYYSFLARHTELLEQCISEYNSHLKEFVGNSNLNTNDSYLQYLLDYKIKKFEFFQDAPFRTAPKVDSQKYESEDEFLKMLYNK
jgi:hypothetical protein